MKTKKIIKLEAEIQGLRSWTEATSIELNALRNVNGKLQQEVAEKNALTKHLHKVQSNLFDLVELHLAVMKRVKIDYSTTLIDSLPKSERLYGSDGKE